MNTYVIALQRNGEEFPFEEICQQEHLSLDAARRCWFAKPLEYRRIIRSWCDAHDCRVVIWEVECIDRIHALHDA